MSDYRNKLIRTFWWIAKEITGSGVDGKEVCYAMVQEKFNERSLKNLSNDELKAVIEALKKRTGVKLTKTVKKKKVFVEPATGDAIIEMASAAQLKLIDDYAGKLNMSNWSLGKFLEHCLRGGLLTIMNAQRIIEIMKDMHKRGWEGKAGEQESKVFH